MSKKQEKPSGSSVYDMLLDAIDCGDLSPGSRLREVEIAERFGISRTPVREALKRLEQQGLVTHEPHHGAVVTVLDYREVGELYLVREVMEGTAARLAALHATDVEINVLREMVEADREFTDNPGELMRRNKLFHRQIHLLARNRFLDDLLENMRVSLVLLAGTTLAIQNRGAQSLDEHQEIVDAIARRDPDAAEKAARAHINNAYRARIRLQAELEQ
ncbi:MULTISPECIES: GntR family transcriptional regulator [Thalassospira]|uniref:GntR family transcriptional regulator n=2 Tax=Thalassospira TaxID=168934 RepID=A0A367W2K0_9PROT|nr:MULTISPECIES: GntR family transcriptional regulator [Thalassospira]MDG4717902.1 GntR family transcriptional regulator [Thalassospira sp. FZY0004]RCK32411.1 GntR family transcriptional regulator [Thalassospira profundimaris]